jgi:hypothetical protein
MTNKLKTIAPKEASTQHNVAARVPRHWYSVDTYVDDRGDGRHYFTKLN